MQQSARTPKQIGAIVRRARRNAGLTQAALAVKIGLRQATVSRLERGEDDTRLTTLLDVLAALGLQITIDERGKRSIEDIERLF
jgi:HTH-type transcriptional regulator/antitoxin HipB